MNPQAVWDQLLSAYRDGDWDRIERSAENLLAWLDRDGAPPTILPCDLDPDWDRALARAGCLFALDTVRSAWSIPDRALETRSA